MKSVLRQKHSSTIFQRIVRKYQYLTMLFSLDLLKANFRLMPMIFVDYLLMVHYVVSAVYAVITKWDDLGQVLRSLCLQGINVQLLVKLTMILYYRKELFELSEDILTIHKESEGEYQDVMYNWTRRIEIVGEVQGVLYFFNAIGFCLFPLFEYFVHHEKTLIYDLLLPFDVATISGYSITIAIQIFLSYAATIGVYALDLLFLLIIFSGAAYIGLLACDCKILSKKIIQSCEDDEFKNTKSQTNNRASPANDECGKLLLHTIKRSQKIHQFFSKLCLIYETGSFFQVYCCAVSILLCVFVAKISNWFGIYLIALTLSFELISYCVLGTIIEYKSEEVAKSVYDIPWHDLAIEDQKNLKFLLQHVQKTITITVFGATKLNVQTGCNVFNTIYSTYLLMEQIY